MRDDYQRFQNAEAEVVAVAPDTIENARSFFERHRLPFPCLADPDRRVFRMYDVQSRLVSLGQRPALFVIDKEGIVQYAHLGSQQWEIPTDETVLAQLEALNVRSE